MNEIDWLIRQILHLSLTAAALAVAARFGLEVLVTLGVMGLIG